MLAKFIIVTLSLCGGGAMHANTTTANNHLALTPPRGFSTWNAFPVHSIDEGTARRYLAGLVDAGLPALGYKYFIVDEPCFTGRDAATGELLENRTTWPGGLKAFGAELRAAGMELGIYTCVGPKTCGGCVASEGREEQDVATFASWGAKYLKVDSCSRNCTAAAGVPNATACGRTLWTRYATAIAKLQVPMVYSIVCNCDPARGSQPWKWAAGPEGVANSWRTNIDVQVGWQAIPYIVDAQRRMGGNGSWCPLVPGAGDAAPGSPCAADGSGACPSCAGPESFSAAPGQWNDMDMLIVGTRSALFPDPLSVAQSVGQLSMWSIMKSPLLVSADLTNVSDPALIEVLQNEEVLAVSDDALGAEAVRLGDGAAGAADGSAGEIYVGALEHGGWAVVFFNRHWQPQNATLAVADCLRVGLQQQWQHWRQRQQMAGQSWAVRDLWTKTDNGTVTAGDHITVRAQAETAVMITLTPV